MRIIRGRLGGWQSHHEALLVTEQSSFSVIIGTLSDEHREQVNFDRLAVRKKRKYREQAKSREKGRPK